MVNLLIIVLRAVAALANALIAILELIRNHHRLMTVEIGIGGRPLSLLPCHTTRHAGPHRAVREFEVTRVGASLVCRTTQDPVRD